MSLLGVVAALTSEIWLTIWLSVVAAISGVALAILVFALLSPFMKDKLLHDPNQPNKISMFIEVGTGRKVAIDYSGRFFYAIDGEASGPVHSDALFGLWMLYKQYVWNIAKVHVYVPYFTEPKTYDLPRYKVKEEGGKRVYRVIKEDEPGYYSNHVRVAPFTWYFEYAGAEIQTVPFTVEGSAQVMIDPDKIEEALYLTESWNVLLDQALKSVARNVVRSKVTLDDVIGNIDKQIWAKQKANDTKEAITSLVATLIQKGVKDYVFDTIDNCSYSGKKLADLGIIILKIDITDFEDELPPEQRSKLHAPAIGRQEGRARALSDQGVAAGQESMAKVLMNLDPTLQKAILENRALVDAVAKGGDVSTLITALITSLRK